MGVKNLQSVNASIRKKGDTLINNVKDALFKNAKAIEVEATQNKPDKDITIDGVRLSNNGLTAIIAAHSFGNGDWAIYWEVGTGKSYKELAPSLTPEMRAIALTAYKNGKGTITPHPYMFPAYVKYKKQFIEDVKKAIRKI